MRNRIQEHRRVRAGDLVPHELNPRRHGGEQREALQAILGEVGFARSLLAFELPDGRLKLIDGHLRQQELGPDSVIDVEVLDVNDEEARKLLLSIDPFVELATLDAPAVAELQATTRADSEVLNAIWATIRLREATVVDELDETVRRDQEATPLDRYLVVIECRSEEEQVNLLRRFKREGLNVSAKNA